MTDLQSNYSIDYYLAELLHESGNYEKNYDLLHEKLSRGKWTIAFCRKKVDIITF
jgi:hypothetical protein